MPMYTYKCTTEGCNCTKSKLVKLQDRESVQFDCSECNSVGSLKFVSFVAGEKQAGIIFKGRGYHEGY